MEEKITMKMKRILIYTIVLIVIFWFANSVSYYAQNNTATDLLIKAVKNNQKGFDKISVIERAIRAGADVNIRDSDDNPILAIAIKKDDIEVVNLLVAAGANLNALDEYGDPLISMVNCYQHEDIAKILIEAGVDLNVKNSNGEWVLATTLSNEFKCHKEGESDFTITKLLIESGASVNIKNVEGRPLIYDVINSREIRLLELLIEAGAEDLNYVDDYGDSLMKIAIVNQSEEIVKILIEAGADVNLIDDKGMHLLSYAIEVENESILRRLVEAGANVHFKDQDGNSLVYHAVRKGKGRSLVKILVDAGVDVTAKNNKNLTVLDLIRQERNRKKEIWIKNIKKHIKEKDLNLY